MKTVLGLLLLVGFFFLASAKRVVDNPVTNPKNAPSFAIDYDKGTFLLDGEPFRYISGSVHYFRIHPSQWKDRLERVRALGFNAIQFYIPWNFHEIEKGQYNFQGSRDFVRFIKIAADLGMFTLLRMGPYACGEWENGGLPYWLIKNNTDIKMRSSDKRFTSEVTRFFEKIAPLIRPLLRQNGGPILMVQIENEYGSYDACDRAYTAFLRDEAWRLLGNDTVLYTTDGGSEGYLKCGAVPGVFATIDFGPTSKENMAAAFQAQKKYLPGGKGPLVNSEYYPGWLVLWGQRTQELPSVAGVVQGAIDMYEMGASLNFYMVYGGTNFGFWNGAETNAPVITSYDYSAPISESGELTEKYLALRDWVSDIPNWPNKPTVPPQPLPSQAYPTAQVILKSPYTSKDLKKNCQTSKNPLNFEDLSHPFGFVLYTHVLTNCGEKLNISSIKDFGYVKVGSKQQRERFINHFNEKSQNIVRIENCQVGDLLEILVENQGRQTYETINDHKGILSPVYLDGQLLEDWVQCTIDVPYEANDAGAKRVKKQKKFRPPMEPLGSSGLYEGTFQVDTLADTFLAMDNWGKGFAIVNGQNVGRYWSSEGPQYSLYVPQAILKKGENKLQVFELEGVQNCTSAACAVPFAAQMSIRFDNDQDPDDQVAKGSRGPWKKPSLQNF